MTYESIVISSGHGKYVRGASGVMDEVDEARKVTEQLATEIRARGIEVRTYHDDISKSQNENLNRIVDFHNSCDRDLDISVHFNAFDGTANGTEVLYLSQRDLAAKLSAAIAASGFKDRGAKERTDLFFLNNTEQPAVLLEVCFCDNERDSGIYCDTFATICSAMADVLGGKEITTPTPPEPEVPVSEQQLRIDIKIDGFDGDVLVTVNGTKV